MQFLKWHFFAELVAKMSNTIVTHPSTPLFSVAIL